MDIRQLEAFVYTVKYQSFSLAAQKLYLFAADRQFAYQQSGKRTSYAAFEANDQEFVGHARRADPLQLRSRDPESPAESDSGTFR